jgi:hypothetical protein
VGGGRLVALDPHEKEGTLMTALRKVNWRLVGSLAAGPTIYLLLVEPLKPPIVVGVIFGAIMFSDPKPRDPRYSTLIASILIPAGTWLLAVNVAMGAADLFAAGAFLVLLPVRRVF